MAPRIAEAKQQHADTAPMIEATRAAGFVPDRARTSREAAGPKTTTEFPVPVGCTGQPHACAPIREHSAMSVHLPAPQQDSAISPIHNNAATLTSVPGQPPSCTAKAVTMRQGCWVQMAKPSRSRAPSISGATVSWTMEGTPMRTTASGVATGRNARPCLRDAENCQATETAHKSTTSRMTARTGAMGNIRPLSLTLGAFVPAPDGHTQCGPANELVVGRAACAWEVVF